MDIGETKEFLNIDLRFRSGNNTPISKAYVPKTDWDLLKQALERHLVCLVLADVPISDLREGALVIAATKTKIGRITNVRLAKNRQCRDDELDIEWLDGRHPSTIFHQNADSLWLIPGTPSLDPVVAEFTSKEHVAALLDRIQDPGEAV